MSRDPVVCNAKWIIGCRVFQALLQLVIGTLTARYLGPPEYGLIHYAASVTAFAVPVMQLGLQATLVQEYVQQPEQAGELMGTALVLNLFSGCVSLAGVAAFAMVSSRGDGMTVLICGLYGTSLMVQSLELVQYWFQARLQAKYASVAMLTGYFAVCGYRVFLLVTGKRVEWFALSHTLEYAVSGIMLLIQCRRVGLRKLTFRLETARALLGRSWHYIPAALLVACFQNSDRVLLTLLAGDGANGLYTCAVTCGSMTNFVFYALVDSVRPVILTSRRKSPRAFEEKVAGLYALMNLLSLGQSLGMTLLAGPMVGLLYGAEYAAAVPVLRILVWNTAFSMMGAVRNIWLLAEEKHHLLWRINLIGAAANIALNALLVPLWRAEGAALASVLTQFFTNFVAGFWFPAMKDNQKLLLKGLNPAKLRLFSRAARGPDSV